MRNALFVADMITVAGGGVGCVRRVGLFGFAERYAAGVALSVVVTVAVTFCGNFRTLCCYNTAAEAICVACITLCGAGCGFGVFNCRSADMVRGILCDCFGFGCFADRAGVGFYTG